MYESINTIVGVFSSLYGMSEYMTISLNDFIKESFNMVNHSFMEDS